MSRELFVFAVMIICGAVISVVFDLLRAMRTEIKPNNAVVALIDILFWVFASFAVLAAVWNFNSGIFRFYEIAGLALGAVFYFLLLSHWILKLFLFIIRNILKFVKLIFKILLTPPLFLYKILVVPMKKYKNNKRRKGQGTCDE